MGKMKKEKESREEERRRLERFAWLGPLMERRKAEPEPLAKPEEEDEPEETGD